MSEEKKIKSMTLVFPHGATAKQCDEIANRAQKLVNAKVSEGGFELTRMPFAAGDERMEFSEDAMVYVYGYEKE